MPSETCEHPHVMPVFLDQTLGVKCGDCGTVLGYCWMDEHFSESLWNRAAPNESGAIPCEQSRDDVCALCGETFVPETRKSAG